MSTSLDGKCTARFHRANRTVVRCSREEGHENWHQSTGDVEVWRSHRYEDHKPLVWMSDEQKWFVTYQSDPGLFADHAAESRDEAFRFARGGIDV